MAISVKCACGKQLRAKDEAAGRTAKCPGCGNPVTFPALAVQVEDNPFVDPMWTRPPEAPPEPPEPPPKPAPPPLPKAEWHYSRGGDKHGPVPLHTVQRLAASLELSPTDLVWKEGMAEWVPLSNVPGLQASPPPKRARRIKPIGAAFAALAVVGVVALIALNRLGRAEPLYGGKPQSAWAEQLKDKSPERQKRAAEALGGIGWEAYPSAPDLMRVLNKSEDADTAVAVMDALYKIASDTVMSPNRGKQDMEAKDKARDQLAKLIPRLIAQKDHAYRMRQQTQSALDGTGGLSREVELDFIKQERKWSKIYDVMERKALLFKEVTDRHH